MGLSTQGYDILEASNGKIALEMLDEGPALIILDLGLPDIQGHELLRMIRGRNESVPIVVLSSRGDEAGKVQALDLGADDYLTKPFGMDELLARMRAALRHQLQVQGERPVFRAGDLQVDLVRRIVKVGEREVKLSPKEYELLRVLVQHAGKVLTHRFLLKELWDELTDAIPARLCAPGQAEDRGRSRATAIRADRNRDRLSAARAGLMRGGPPGATLKISDLLSLADVMIDIRASNKGLLMRELAGKAAASLGVSVDVVVSHLLKREGLGSTGIGRGVAIPHARLRDLQHPYGLLAKLEKGIEFDAIDGQAVDIVFVLLLPAAVENEALAALALVARTFRSPETLARLRAAKSASELYAAMA